LAIQKLSELKRDARTSIQSELEAKATGLGLDVWESEDLVRKNEVFGVCGLCSNFQYAATKFKIVRAVCSEMEMKLSEDEPIDECTCFNKRGSMSLKDMWDIAYLIDVLKDPVGF
jgi:hypothetical protein